jgi:hypothetical protein
MEKLNILSISKHEIIDVLKERLPDALFVDTDLEINDKIYFGDMFDEMSEDDLDSEELRSLTRLKHFSKDCTYILLTD